MSVVFVQPMPQEEKDVRFMVERNVRIVHVKQTGWSDFVF